MDYQTLEKYIIEINNNLHSLCKFMNLELQINMIHPSCKHIDEGEKRAIVATILAEKQSGEMKKVTIESFGITEEEFIRFSKDNVVKKYLEKSNKERLEDVIEKRKEVNRKIGENLEKNRDRDYGVAPPKINWKNIITSEIEKEELIKKIKNDHKSCKIDSEIFKSEHKLNHKEFLRAFKFLEDETNDENLIIEVVSEEEKIKEHLNIIELTDKIENIYLGKYLILSVYDIKNQMKIFVGLDYASSSGTISLDVVGSRDCELKNSQKLMMRDFFDSANIVFEEHQNGLELEL